MKKSRSQKKQRHSLPPIMHGIVQLIIAISLVLIAIGDAVIWAVTRLGFFITWIANALLQKAAILRRSPRVMKKILLRSRRFLFRRGSTVFHYKKHTKKVTKQRQKYAQSIYISLFTKLKYLLAGIIFSFFFIFLPLVAIVFIQDLPSPDDLSLRQVPQTTKIYDRNGILLQQIYATQNRTLVPLKDIPINLQHATIAIEDKNFYKHPGFDLPSIIRAAYEDISGKPIQGGSTITQQLIKSSLLTSARSITRKFKEIILAFWAERLYTKNQILEMYFNQVPYGGTAWGIEAASEVYFNKNVKDVDLAQSAVLAGLTAAPTDYSPFNTNNSTLWKKRQIAVLDQMVDDKYISKDQAIAAAKEQITFNTQPEPLLAPHFVNYITNYLEQKYGPELVEKGGLIVTTSLDVKTQNMAQQIVTNEVNNDAYLNLTNGAVVITDPTNGDILAMVGSKDFNDPNGGNVNLATSLRQPGSSIKVVTYSAALQHGFTAATILDDTPVTFSNPWETYSPVNYDGSFHGKVPLRIALGNSFNIPAVKTLNQIGIPTMVNLGKQMGIQSWGDPSQYGLSITLGGADVTMLDMSRVYGTLANQGKEVDLNPILKITDYKGNVLEQKDNSNIPSNQVIDPGIAFIMGDILADNNARMTEFGPNSPLNIPGHYVSVKTGTTDNKRDNWTDGYTPNFVVVTWVGNNDNSPMSQALASGITGAAPIWNKIMTNLVNSKPNNPPTPPSDVVQKSCYGHNEYFISGTENSVSCSYAPSPSISPINRP